MTRRFFTQAVAGGLSALKALGSATKEKITGNPNGWEISWVPGSNSDCGYWLALPETADRPIALRSVVSSANTIDKARKRIIQMIHESQNGKHIIPNRIYSAFRTGDNIDDSQSYEIGHFEARLKGIPFNTVTGLPDEMESLRKPFIWGNGQTLGTGIIAQKYTEITGGD